MAEKLPVRDDTKVCDHRFFFRLYRLTKAIFDTSALFFR